MDPSVWKFLLLHEHRLKNVEILQTWILRTKKSQIWWKIDGKREKSARKYWIFRGVNRCGFWKKYPIFLFRGHCTPKHPFLKISRTLNFRGQVMKTTPFPRFLERSCVHVVNGEWTHRVMGILATSLKLQFWLYLLPLVDPSCEILFLKPNKAIKLSKVNLYSVIICWHSAS